MVLGQVQQTERHHKVHTPVGLNVLQPSYLQSNLHAPNDLK